MEAQRGTNESFTRGEIPPLLGSLGGEAFVDRRSVPPRRQPLLPRLQIPRRPHEIVVVDPLGDETRRPVLRRDPDPVVGHPILLSPRGVR
jgi:hypothetical protein